MTCGWHPRCGKRLARRYRGSGAKCCFGKELARRRLENAQAELPARGWTTDENFIFSQLLMPKELYMYFSMLNASLVSKWQKYLLTLTRVSGKARSVSAVLHERGIPSTSWKRTKYNIVNRTRGVYDTEKVTACVTRWRNGGTGYSVRPDRAAPHQDRRKEVTIHSGFSSESSLSSFIAIFRFSPKKMPLRNDWNLSEKSLTKPLRFRSLARGVTSLRAFPRAHFEPLTNKTSIC